MTTTAIAPTTTARLRATLFALTLTILGTARMAAAAICLNCPQQPPPVPQPPPSVSVPNFAFQVTPCPDPNSVTNITSSLSSGLSSAITQLDFKHNGPSPAPDVRSKCTNDVLTIAAWVYPENYLGTWDTYAARNLGLALANVRQPGEAFGFRVTRDAFDLLLDIAWEDEPKVMNKDGIADPNGSIHLVDFDVTYWDAVWNIPWLKAVDTRVNGYYAGPFTQTNFYAGVTDYLMLSDVTVDNFTVGRVFCSSNATWSMETTIESVLAEVFGALHNVDNMVSNFSTQGPGCQVANMLPLQTLVGNNGKALFNYTRLNSNADGITGGGSFVFDQRTPAVKINGPSPFVDAIDAPGTATYTLDITDMRAPYTVTWTADGTTQTHVYNNASPALFVTWNLGNAKPVSYLYRNITASVIDADGHAASSTQQFSIKVVWETGVPPICKNRPNLPQCNP